VFNKLSQFCIFYPVSLTPFFEICCLLNLLHSSSKNLTRQIVSLYLHQEQNKKLGEEGLARKSAVEWTSQSEVGIVDI